LARRRRGGCLHRDDIVAGTHHAEAEVSLGVGFHLLDETAGFPIERHVDIGSGSPVAAMALDKDAIQDNATAMRMRLRSEIIWTQAIEGSRRKRYCNSLR
jgi:hypothetical protein